ncbi:MAG: hypothetical protein BMS9Abin18_0793 [Zetaproteobacteria bacterium]|nr:MAG: hypothetical protein BMS9Abin18_0793 [Zetaproteobacteria bacterium]
MSFVAQEIDWSHVPDQFMGSFWASPDLTERKLRDTLGSKPDWTEAVRYECLLL